MGTDRDNKKRLKDIFKTMSGANKVNLDDPHNDGAFMLNSMSESEFQVLFSQNIDIGIKMGLYMEIFYSPYDDEVLELFIEERYGALQLQADSTADYDNEDRGNQEAFIINKYKSSKMLWVDLEAGEYTIQIINKR